ncbi:hypothetical protein JTB14_019297 [Gonioctena quinquepunctata]|nr:hypothetical protein JTB14_019297 [Gonioctena quinquepunctata]
MSGTGTCFLCRGSCIFKESKTETFGYPCDLCKRVICKNCSNISATEIRVVQMTARIMPFFCTDCRENILKLPDLVKRVSDMEVEIHNNTSDMKGKLLAVEQRIMKLELNTQTKPESSLPLETLEVLDIKN